MKVRSPLRKDPGFVGVAQRTGPELGGLGPYFSKTPIQGETLLPFPGLWKIRRTGPAVVAPSGEGLGGFFQCLVRPAEIRLVEEPGRPPEKPARLLVSLLQFGVADCARENGPPVAV